MTATSCTLPRLHVGAGTTIGALTTFPLWVQAPSVRGLHWSGTELTIAEIAGSPSVDELTVINRSNRPAVLLEGDLVEGGLQHRMVAASGLVAAGTTGLLAARCIEQGRWDGQQVTRSLGAARPTACTPPSATTVELPIRATCGAGSTASSSGSVTRPAPR